MHGARLTSRLIQQVESAIVATDLEGVVHYWNRAAEALYGYTARQAIGRSALELANLRPDLRERVLAQAMQRGRWQGELLIRRADGVCFPGLVSFAPLRDDAGAVEGFVSVTIDISRQKQAEADRIELVAELQREKSDRSSISRALQVLRPQASVEETAIAFCQQVIRLASVDTALLVTLDEDGATTILGWATQLDRLRPDGQPRLKAPASALPRGASHELRTLARLPAGSADGAPAVSAHLTEWLGVPVDSIYATPMHAEDGIAGVLLAAFAPHLTSSAWQRDTDLLDEYAGIAESLIVPAIRERVAQRAGRARIRRIIAEGALTTLFQPVVDIVDRSVVGYEALTRFADGCPPPERFEEAARVGLQLELEHACLSAAMAAGKELPQGAWLSINVSPDYACSSVIRSAVSGCDRELVLEITEHQQVHDYGALRAAIARLGSCVDIAVDDAGAGYASLNHVIELRPRFVKLDQRLVRGVATTPLKQAILTGLQHFSARTGCRLIAEGIESLDDWALLRDLDVRLAQGYLLGVPQTAARLRERTWVGSGRARVPMRPLTRVG